MEVMSYFAVHSLDRGAYATELLSRDYSQVSSQSHVLYEQIEEMELYHTWHRSSSCQNCARNQLSGACASQLAGGLVHLLRLPLLFSEEALPTELLLV